MSTVSEELLQAATTAPTDADYENQLLTELGNQMGNSDLEYVRNTIKATNPEYLADPIKALQEIKGIKPNQTNIVNQTDLANLPDSELTQQQLQDKYYPNGVYSTNPDYSQLNKPVTLSEVKKADLSTATQNKAELLKTRVVENKTKLDPNANIELADLSREDFYRTVQPQGYSRDKADALYFKLQQNKFNKQKAEADKRTIAYGDLSSEDIAQNTALSVAKFPLMVGETAYALGNLFTGGLLENETNFGKNFQESRDIINAAQSDQLQAQRELSNEEFASLTKQEEAFRNSNKDIFSTVKSFVKEYGESALIMAKNPSLLWDATVESGLAFTVPAAVSASVRKTVLSGLTEQQKREFLADTAKMSNLEKNERLAALISIAGLEAGGNSIQVQSSILNTPFEELEKNSPLYRDLTTNGKYSPEDARKYVAANAGLTTYALTAGAAGTVSKLVGSDKIAADISKGLNTVGSRLFKTGAASGNELVEESLQSGLGQLVQNFAMSAADSSQTLLEGVGVAAGQGGITGGLSGGLTQGTIATVATSRDALQPVIDEAVKRGREIVKDTQVAKQVEAATEAKDFNSLKPTQEMSSSDVLIRMKQLATAMVKQDVISEENQISQINEVFEELQNAYEDKYTLEKRDVILQDIQKNPDNYSEIANSVAVLRNAESTVEQRQEASAEINRFALTQAAEQASTDIYEDESNTFNQAVAKVTALYKDKVRVTTDKINKGETLSESEVKESVRVFGSNPDAFEMQDIDAFINSDSFKNLNQKSKNLINSAKNFKQSLIDAETVSSVIINGGKLGGQSWRGLRTYINNFDAQLKNKNKDGALAVYQDLTRWVVTRKDKLEEWKSKPVSESRTNTINTMEKENAAMMAGLRLMAAKMGVTPTTVNKADINVETITTDTPVISESSQQETEQSTEVETTAQSTQATETTSVAQSGNATEQPQAATVSVDTQAAQEANDHLDNSEINDTGLNVTEDEPVKESTLKRLVSTFKKYDLPNAYRNLSFDSFYRTIAPKAAVGNLNSITELSYNEAIELFTIEAPIEQFNEIKSLTSDIVKGFNSIDFTLPEKDTSAFRQISTNPYYTLLDSEGNLSNELKELISIATLKVLATDYKLHTETNTDQEIKAAFGIDKKEKVSGDVLKPARYAGVRTSVLVSAISSEVSKVLGIKPLNELDHDTYKAAVDSIATLGLSAALASNIVERVNVRKSKTEQLGFTRLARKNSGKFSDTALRIKELGKTPEWFEAMFSESNIKQLPSYIKPTKVDTKYSSSNPFTQMQVIPKDVQEILLTHSQRPNSVNEDVQNIFEILPQELQEIVAGIIPEAYFKDKHVYERESIEAANEAARRILENYKAFADSTRNVNGEYGNVYFEHILWANDRIGIKGSEINPQENKFIRHMINLNDFKVKVDPNDNEVFSDFKTAVAVAFENISGVKLDQAEQKEIDTGFDKVLQNSLLNEVLDLIELNEWDTKESVDKFYSLISSAENPSQGFHALMAVKSYLEAEGKPFTTSLSLEVDGKTNGFAFSTLQLSGHTEIDLITQAMERAGVYTEDGVNYKTWKVDGGNYDTYEVLAQVMKEVAENQSANNDPILATLVGLNVVDVTKEDGSVKKIRSYTISRNLAKNPVMVTMYGAGIDGVITNFINDVIENIYKTISENPSKVDKVLIKQETIRALKAFSNEAHSLDVNTANIDFTFSEEATNDLRAALDKQYREVMKDALEHLFGTITESRNVLVEASNVSYKIFKELYDKKYQEKLDALNTELYNKLSSEVTSDNLEGAFNYYKIKTLNPKQLSELIESLKGQYPTFKSYFLNTDNSGLVIPKTKNNTSSLEVFLERNKFSVQYFSKKKGEYVEIPHTIDSKGNITFNLDFPSVLRIADQVDFKFYPNNTTIPYSSKSGISLQTIYGNTLPKASEHSVVKFNTPQKGVTITNENTYENEINSTTMDISNGVLTIENPGVSLAPKGIHSLDGSVQLAIMKAMPMFNVHDAAYYPLGLVSKGSTLANKAFYTVNSEFNIFSSTKDMLLNSLDLAYNNGLEIKPSYYATLASVENAETSSKEVKAQYFDKVKGVYQYTNNKAGFNLESEQKTLNLITLLSEMQSNGYFGSSNKKIRSFQVDTAFDINKDNVEAIYNNLGSIGVNDPVQVSTDLQAKLNGIMSGLIIPLVQKTKVLIQNTAPETLGSYERKGGDRVIKMQLGSQAPQVLAQSRQEVFVHELVHSVMETPIEVPTAYRKRLEQLYTIAQKYLKPADLIQGPVQTRTDLVKAKAVYDYVFNNTSAVQTDSGLANGLVKRTLSNGLHEFVSFGLTNEAFINALGKLFNNPQALKEFREGEKYSPMKGDPKSGLFVKALNMVNEVFNYFLFKVRKLMDKVNGLEGKNADEVLYELVTRIAHVERKQKSQYDILSDKANAILNKTVKTVIKPVSDVLEKSNYVAAQAVGRTIRLIPRLDSNKVGNLFNRVVNHYSSTKDSLVASLGRELIGRTEDNRNIANLLMMSREFIDKLRAETHAAAATMVRSAMHRDLTVTESGAIQAAIMHTDAAVLFDGNTQDFIDLFADSNKRSKAILNISNELKKLSPKFGQYYINHAQNTGYYIVHKKPLFKGDVMFNATQIANLRTLNLKPDADLNKVIPLIDRLASLYAINSTDTGTLTVATEFMKQELAAKDNKSNGIQFLVDSLKNYKKQSKQALFQNSDELMRKGYVKEVFNPNTGFMVVDVFEKAELERQGVEVIGKISKDEFDNNTDNAWLVKSDALALNTRQRGAMSITNRKASGTNLVQARNQNNDNPANALIAAKDFAKIKSSRALYNNKMTSTQPVLAQNENMVIPVYDATGDVSGYRYVMSEANRISVAERVDLFDNTFGAMTALIGDKINTSIINNKIIDELYADYRKNYKLNPKAYTKVHSGSADKENQEMWALMPKETREYAEKVFGEPVVYVSKENYRRVFGQKKADLGNLGDWFNEKFQNTYLETFGKYAQNILNHKWTAQTENIWKEIVSFAKDRIVIVSGSVLLMNILSNMTVLFVEGVNPLKALRYQQEGWVNLKEFQKNGVEVKKLKLQLADSTLTTNKVKEIKARINFLENKMSNNPVRPLVDRGVFQSIIEDVDMLDEQFSFQSKLERTLEPITDKIPDVVKDIGSAVFMTKNTSMYQFFRDVTQMSDFIARYTLHRHNLDNGVKFEESIDNIMDTFINYEEPTHKTVQWLNDMGIMMFTKFFIRIQKVILRQLKERPLDVMGLWGIESYLGTDISSIDDSFASPQDFINRFYSPLDSLETAITPPLPDWAY